MAFRFKRPNILLSCAFMANKALSLLHRNVHRTNSGWPSLRGSIEVILRLMAAVGDFYHRLAGGITKRPRAISFAVVQ